MQPVMQSAPPLPPRPTFFDGVKCFGAAFAFLLRTPSALPYALVPALLVIVLSAAGLFASFHWVSPLIRDLLPATESRVGDTAVGVISFVGTVLVATLGALLALSLAPTLAAPALERLVTLTEEEIGAPPRAPLGFVREIVLGLRASFIGFCLFAPVLAILFLSELIFPVSVVATVPIRFAVAALWLAYTMFDYPQSLRGFPIRARLRLLRGALAPTIGYGLTCSLLFWTACAIPLLLPVGVIAATQLFWRVAQSDPDVQLGERRS
jgi:CysZ protein